MPNFETVIVGNEAEYRPIVSSPNAHQSEVNEAISYGVDIKSEEGSAATATSVDPGYMDVEPSTDNQASVSDPADGGPRRGSSTALLANVSDDTVDRLDTPKVKKLDRFRRASTKVSYSILVRCF